MSGAGRVKKFYSESLQSVQFIDFAKVKKAEKRASQVFTSLTKFLNLKTSVFILQYSEH